MDTELTQKRFFTKHVTKLSTTKVVYKTTKFNTETEITLAFEDLTRNKESYTTSKDFLLVLCSVSFIITFFCFIYRNDKGSNPDIWILWSLIAFTFGIAFHLTKETLWKVRLQNGTYLFFYKSIPDREIVDQFIDNLFYARDKYLREMYFAEVNKNLSYEAQKNDLQWLRRIEAISTDEFNNLKKELDEAFQNEVKKIGFN